MDHHTREQQRRETEVRGVESHADIASERESAQRIASLAKRKGAAMKLGQHMSYFDTTWPEDGLDRSGASCEASRWHACAGELTA